MILPVPDKEPIVFPVTSPTFTEPVCKNIAVKGEPPGAVPVGVWFKLIFAIVFPSTFDVTVLPQKHFMPTNSNEAPVDETVQAVPPH